jgi:glycosyltransferase involved in cell wall biosynthesis
MVFGLTLAPPGGAERLLVEEASHFAREHEVTVLAPEYDEAYVAEALPGVEVVAYGRPHKGWRGVKRLWPLLSERDPDLVTCHYAEEEVGVVCARLGVPYVPHVHGSVLWFPDTPRLVPHVGTAAYERLVAEVPGHREFHDPPELTTRGRLWATVGERVRGWALRTAATVFTGSERVRRELAGLYDAESRVVRPGVAAAWLEDARTEAGRELSDATHDLLSVSRLDPRKRVGVQVDALADLRETHDAHLTVCGTGPDEERLRDRVRDRGLEAHVTFAGYVPDADLPGYYAGADAFGCSAWMSYGLSPLEAYGAGSPVALATDTYAKELLDGEPAVAVGDPEPTAWADAWRTLLDGDDEPNTAAVPTWAGFCAEKRRILRGQELVHD